jgi:hypothetical protein
MWHELAHLEGAGGHEVLTCCGVQEGGLSPGCAAAALL